MKFAVDPQTSDRTSPKTSQTTSQTSPETIERSTCPVEYALKAIGGRWKVLILRELFRDTRRFGELHRALHGITQKMLTQQLRELEQDGIVNRYVYPQVPPKVEYSLTPMGQTLKPILDSMHAWGEKYLQQIDASSASL
jgi:DNA-binding HxlR family transcriptional regulator